MDSLELKPVRRAAGTVRLPGSKSISNRVLLLAALAQGATEVGEQPDRGHQLTARAVVVSARNWVKASQARGA